MDPGEGMGLVFKGLALRTVTVSHVSGRVGRVTASPLPCFQSLSVLWKVVCFEFKMLESPQMQLQVSGRKISGTGSLPAQGSLHLKFLGMASGTGKCN